MFFSAPLFPLWPLVSFPFLSHCCSTTRLPSSQRLGIVTFHLYHRLVLCLCSSLCLSYRRFLLSVFISLCHPCRRLLVCRLCSSSFHLYHRLLVCQCSSPYLLCHQFLMCCQCSSPICHNNNVHLSCAHQRPEHSHDTY